MDQNINEINGVLAGLKGFKKFLEEEMTGIESLDIISNPELYLSLTKMIYLTDNYKYKYNYIKYELPQSQGALRRRFVPTEGPGTPSRVRYICGSDSDSD